MTPYRGLAAVVIDASAALEFLGGDPVWRDRWARWANDEAMLLAPPHFPAETANGMIRSERLTTAEASERLHRLYETGFELADRGKAGIVHAIDLAEQHGLSVYDALYLQLAIDVDGELATLDLDLRRAAVAERVNVIG